jgi:RNA polymerase sigma factor (sigma-70 family)
MTPQNLQHQFIADYYAQHQEEMVNYVDKRVKDIMLSEDVVQEVFYRLLRKGQMISEVTLPHLVYVSLNNSIVDYFRKTSSYLSYADYMQEMPSTVDDVEEQCCAHELTHCLDEILSKFSESRQQIYRMNLYDDLSVNDISTKLGIRYKATEYQLRLVKNEVRQRLASRVG